jgi:hypothetical protein
VVAVVRVPGVTTWPWAIPLLPSAASQGAWRSARTRTVINAGAARAGLLLLLRDFAPRIAPNQRRPLLRIPTAPHHIHPQHPSYRSIPRPSLFAIITPTSVHPAAPAVAYCLRPRAQRYRRRHRPSLHPCAPASAVCAAGVLVVVASRPRRAQQSRLCGASHLFVYALPARSVGTIGLAGAP